MTKSMNRAGKQLADQAGDLADQARVQAIEALGGHESHFWVHFGWLLLGAGIGALTAYLLDPDRGRHRQAQLRDQVLQARTTVERELPRRVRGAQEVLQSVQQRLGDSSAAGEDAAGEPASPQWERAHNDDGSLTTPTT